MQLTAGTRVGSYEITAPIGAGGMGEVYRAHDPRLDREIALKILAREHATNDDRRLRFEQEAKSASALSHPNIVTIHEIGNFGESDSRAHFIAMELIQGRSLRDLLSEGAMPVRKLLAVAAQIADGLAAAHAKGIVHRDLKPENIMVTGDGFVKILDFGLAKLLAGSDGNAEERTIAKPAAETTPGTVMGTAAYMSPEQAAGRATDFRSDQFSFGVILYEMITGRRAFQRETAAQTMSAIIEGEPAPLQEIAPRTPPPLRWVVERCLSKDPDERYASTRDLARDLRTMRDRLAEATTSGALTADISSPPRRLSMRMLGVACLAVAAIAGAIGFFAARAGRPPVATQPEFTRLTFRGGVTSAAFTPDGASVLYTASIGGREPQMYLVRRGTSEPQLLGKAPGRIVGISRNGEVAVISHGVLSRMPLGGGAPRGIAENVVNASWAPDGTNLVIVRQTAGGQQIEYPIGTVLTRDVFVGFPRLSPGGKEIAFFQFDGGRWWVAVMNVSDRKVRRLAGIWEGVRGLVWSPDGRTIYATHIDKTHRVLDGISLDGKLRPVARIGRSVDVFDVANDGTLLVAQRSSSFEMFRRNLRSGAEQELTWLDASVPAAMSADGQSLLFSEVGDGGTERVATYLYRAGSDVPVKLGDGDSYDLSRDGKWAIASTQTSPERLLLLPTGVGEPREIAPGEIINFEWASFFPDSKRLLITGNLAGKPSRMHVYELATGKITPLGAEGLRHLVPPGISPDGRFAIAETPGSHLIVSLESGSGRKIDGQSPLVGWSNDGRLFAFRVDGTKVIIELVDLDNAKREPVGSFALADAVRVASIVTLSVTPDGGHVTYAIERDESELYALRP